MMRSQVLSAHIAREHTASSTDPGLLFEYSLKGVMLAGFLELVLYRLISRLGMHFSKLTENSEAIRLTFKTLASVGFLLLNLTSLLLFLMIGLMLIHKLRQTAWTSRFDPWTIPALSLLVLITVVYLIFPPAMLGSVVYNVIAFVVFSILVIEYMVVHRQWSQRLMVGCFFLGICGWLYYQTMSTSYGLLGIVTPPPLVHEFNRLGEALMVVASILVFWAYGTTSFFTRNKIQRRRAVIFAMSGGSIFILLLFLDYFLSLYSPQVAESVRKAGQGIGWIFQMGMGYTFYLPFALYVTGLLCWGYTVVKLILIGRLAGYGLGLMFIAGYALQLSHLTLMVAAGLMLLTLDKRGTLGKLRERGHVQEGAVLASATPAMGSAGQ
ncbi:MAG: hypothetical protein D6704_08075 [Nitrospirae bacterium]|nr:MAG: hypothetical protein D6704_08075 [Nitrospirota bacterium]